MYSSDFKIPFSRPDVPQALREAGYTPLLAALLGLRGITQPEDAERFLRGGTELLRDPLEMLDMAKSGSARTKIKQWFKKERRDENISTGRDMFEGELRSQGLSSAIFADEELLPQLLKRVSFSTVEDLYAAIGYGGITATKAVNRMHDELLRSQKTAEKKTVLDKVNEAAERREKASLKQGKPVHGVLVAGLDNCLIKFSRCCTPIPGDDIVGFITRGQGVSIHRADCANYLNRKNNPDDAGRWIDVGWADVTTDNYTTTILVVSKERQGLVMGNRVETMKP